MVALMMNQYESLLDYQLMELLVKGDRRPFELLIRRHQDKLINYLTRICGNYDTACDLAQDTFIRVFTKADHYKPTHAFSTWLYRIGTNIAINYLRRKKILSFFSLSEEQTDTDGLSFENLVRSELPSPEDYLVKTENVKEVQEALAALPVKYRIPLVLREIEELEYQDIGKILNLPAGTVKSRIFRGREELRKRLNRNRLRETGQLKRNVWRNDNEM